MPLRKVALVAVPLVVLAACAQRYDTSVTPDPNAVSRNSQIEACANELARQTARPREDIKAVYDRDGYNGNAIVNLAGPTGTFQCEADPALSIVRMSRISGQTAVGGG